MTSLSLDANYKIIDQLTLYRNQSFFLLEREDYLYMKNETEPDELFYFVGKKVTGNLYKLEFYIGNKAYFPLVIKGYTHDFISYNRAMTWQSIDRIEEV